MELLHSCTNPSIMGLYIQNVVSRPLTLRFLSCFFIPNCMPASCVDCKPVRWYDVSHGLLNHIETQDPAMLDIWCTLRAHYTCTYVMSVYLIYGVLEYIAILFLKVQLSISQHRFSKRLGGEQAASHQLKQCWPWLNWLNKPQLYLDWLQSRCLQSGVTGNPETVVTTYRITLHRWGNHVLSTQLPSSALCHQYTSI